MSTTEANCDDYEHRPVPNNDKTDTLESYPIDCNQLNRVIPELISNGQLRKQFEWAANHIEDVCYEYAIQRVNNRRNRYYGYAVPYNYNRVVLPAIDRQYDDYVNASYVSGHLCSARYVAAQGPMKSTIDDMWRLIWHLNVAQVVLLTNATNEDDWYCAKYWSRTVRTYANIKVWIIKIESFGDYTVRTFGLECDGEHRQVGHYQYTAWPDWGVPEDCHSFMTFIKEIRLAEQYYSKDKPIVVHCSAGVGRTGSFILIDSMLEMAKQEKQVDILQHFHRLRHQRMNMVEAYDQYVFVHRVLMEALGK
ncbi:receptor-type tyrosine-protein phosphatase alpha-like [Oppia nitens]|uniref:receptor-type tyrosine-protein phosphatase alpha-like n=1 Tax=Oppia nitens TaxID=1686743 RepID=UPI0023DAB472|nr:receptor-type tyrosine-protein phosphatase alpha-like [Oppia nitens]